MGKLGLPVALAIESKGHEVMGYDIRPEPYEYIENKHYPFREEGVPELLENTQIRMTKDIGTLAISNDIVFMPIQTPHQSHLEGDRPLPSERADFDYTYLKKALVDMSKYDSTLAVISTCLPRTYENQLKPLKGNTEYVYTPQFIAMGTVVEDYLNPEFNLLGTDNEKVANKLEDFYATINDAPTLRTDITTAEGIKVAYNTFITMKTVLGNAWGEMSEKLGMNFDDIYKSWELSHKRLLSPKYLKAGMSDGGGCHPRDNIALSHIAEQVEISHNIWEDLMSAREDYEQWHADIAQQTAEEADLPLIILGRSFKPETNIETGSPAKLMANQLGEYPRTHLEDSAHDQVAVYFIATAHDRYKDYDFPKGSIVIDPFGYIEKKHGITVKRLGRK